MRSAALAKYREIQEMPDRLFAVGDIHGCLDETKVLLEFLVGEQSLSARDLVIFIGDYVDRGPQSKQVVDLLLQFKAAFPTTVFLRGNHEDMLLHFLGYPGREGRAYLANGGASFFESYGVSPFPPAADEFGPDGKMNVPVSSEEYALNLHKLLPHDHMAFFLGLERYVICSDYVFAHAGVNPLRDLRSQTDNDLYWIRDEFIQNVHYFRRAVVFGHTPYENVLFHFPYKIGIDTGLVYGNRLSCIEVVQRRVHQVTKGAAKVQSGDFPK